MNRTRTLSAYITVIFTLLLSTATVKSQFKVELKFTASDTMIRPVVHRALVVGIDERATDSLDFSLGEFDFPQHPPDGFDAALIINDGFGTGLSYKDYKRIRPERKFMVQYEFNVQIPEKRNNNPFLITWSYPLPRYIDSAKFTDRLDGSLVSFLFDKKQSSGKITSLLTKYYVNVWYDLDQMATYLAENESKEKEKVIYTQPNETVTVHTQPNSTINLYSSLAASLWSRKTSDGAENIDVSKYSSGVYYLIVQNTNGEVSNHKIMITR